MVTTHVSVRRAARARAAPAIVDESAVRAALGEVMDPEIPVVSVVDLGMVRDVRVESWAGRDGRDGPASIVVELMPTFVGCPAVELIRDAVRDRLASLAPDAEVRVELSFAEPWTSDRITPDGHEALLRSGFAPPTPLADPFAGGVRTLPILSDAAVSCPHCGSHRTVLENAFGPTACRSIRYCADCRQPFEQFKAI